MYCGVLKINSLCIITDGDPTIASLSTTWMSVNLFICAEWRYTEQLICLLNKDLDMNNIQYIIRIIPCVTKTPSFNSLFTSVKYWSSLFSLLFGFCSCCNLSFFLLPQVPQWTALSCLPLGPSALWVCPRPSRCPRSACPARHPQVLFSMRGAAPGWKKRKSSGRRYTVLRCLGKVNHPTGYYI